MRQFPAAISSGDIPEGDKKSIIDNFHKENLKLANDSISKFDTDKRQIATTMVSFSEKSLKAAREELKKCRMRILELATSDSAPDKIYQFIMADFPVSKI
ncbi:MAG: DUF4423 domain-containing protein [Chitinivibrionales bacterium]|nr:DUF4423 domain-containing protein [Chitinivibrionales bacterium]